MLCHRKFWVVCSLFLKPVPKLGETTTAYYPRLLNQYTWSYPPYLERVSLPNLKKKWRLVVLNNIKRMDILTDKSITWCFRYFNQSFSTHLHLTATQQNNVFFLCVIFTKSMSIIGCLCTSDNTDYLLQGKYRRKKFDHRTKKNEVNSKFNLIYSTRSVILDNLNLSIESWTQRCSAIIAPQFRTRDWPFKAIILREFPLSFW